MKFIKTVWFDFYNGIIRNMLLFICPAGIAALVLFNCIYKINTYLALPGCTETYYSFGDLWFYIYGGMEEYVYLPDNPFNFPVVWTIVFFACAILVLNYPTKDMLGTGTHFLVYGGSRSKWWMSKVLWNVLSTVIFHGIILIIILISCFAVNIDIKPGLNVSLVQYLYEFKHDVSLYFVESIPVAVFFLPIVISIAMNLFQMTLALFVNPTYSFIAHCALMVASAFIMTEFLIYNFAMPLRHSWVYEDGFNYMHGYLGAAFMIVLSVVAGLIRFRRYDIIKKEDY